MFLCCSLGFFCLRKVCPGRVSRRRSCRVGKSVQAPRPFRLFEEAGLSWPQPQGFFSVLYFGPFVCTQRQQLHNPACFQQVRSKKSETIQVFLSHSWAANNWQKVALLHVIFNGTCALICGTIAALIFMVPFLARLWF